MDLGVQGQAAQDMMEAERAQRDFLLDDGHTAPTPLIDEQGFYDANGHWQDEGRPVSEDGDTEDGDVEDQDPEDVEREFDEEMFQFVPQGDAAANRDLPMDVDPDPDAPSGSAPHAHPPQPPLDLDDDQDERVYDEFPGAARVIRMDQTLHERWREMFGGNGDHPMGEGVNSVDDTAFSPFASELDWRIAQWAVKDGIGHGSFDRLLSIPGVSPTSLLIIPFL